MSRRDPASLVFLLVEKLIRDLKSNEFYLLLVQNRKLLRNQGIKNVIVGRSTKLTIESK